MFGVAVRAAWREEEEEIEEAGNDSDSDEEDGGAVAGQDLRWLAEGSWDVLSGEVDRELRYRLEAHMELQRQADLAAGSGAAESKTDEGGESKEAERDSGGV